MSTDSDRPRFKLYAKFWPYYLREHAKPLTRGLHYGGTALVILLALIGAATLNIWAFVAMPFAGYGLAWVAHGAVERNRPATFLHPWWSLISDFRMFGLFVFGRINSHLESASVRSADT